MVKLTSIFTVYCSSCNKQYLNFRLHADHKELWVGIIKDLYDKVELFLSKHNTEEFFLAFPERKKPFLYQTNYLLIWRAKKAVKLLTEKYGGKTQLRLMLSLLLLTVVFIGMATILRALGTLGDIDQIIKQASDINVFVSSIVALIVAVVPSARLVYLTVINSETSRGDTIMQGAASIKDSIGFMQTVGKNSVKLELHKHNC
jgi:hypothetical protein